MFSALISLVLRLVLAVATAIVVLVLMALALAALLGLTLWSLLRGRKPVVNFSSFTRARSFRAGRGFAQRSGRRAQAGDVVDVEVREVGEPEGGHPGLPPQGR